MKKAFIFLGLSVLLFSTSAVAQNLPSYLPTNGLVGWWPFNGNANDESGNGNNGTVNGATLASDRNNVFGSAYSFNGVDDNISIPTSPSLCPLSAISFCCWAYVENATSWNQLICKRLSDSQSPYNSYIIAEFGNSSESYTGGVYTTSFTTDNVLSPSQTGEWIHYLYSFDGANSLLYRNGVMETSWLTSGTIQYSNLPLYFGSTGMNGQCLNGKLDDIAIYNRALTQEEVTALYTGTPINGGGGNTSTNPVPPGIPYQAVVRNANGQVAANAAVTARFTLHQTTADGAVEFQETHALTTNAQGLMATVMGQGTAVQNIFAAINWANTNKFLQVEVDLGNGYVDLGTQQLMSVPYAMYAANAPAGPQGPSGPQGPAGADGAVGAAGPQGQAGAGGFTHWVGESFGGGVVFHVYKDALGEEHGLIASQSSIAVAMYQTYYNNDAGPNSISHFSGSENTLSILLNDISMPNEGGFTNAAWFCSEYTQGGFSDWYLPSIKELEELFKSNLTIYNSSNGIYHLKPEGNLTIYWSSTQDTNNSAFAIDVYNGVLSSWKANNFLVRPIRKF
jgi:hypothetical protein